MMHTLALGGQTLDRALTLGARFCHRVPNARALSITVNNYKKIGIQENLEKLYLSRLKIFLFYLIFRKIIDIIS